MEAPSWSICYFPLVQMYFQLDWMVCINEKLSFYIYILLYFILFCTVILEQARTRISFGINKVLFYLILITVPLLSW